MMNDVWNTFLQGLAPVITVILEVALVLLVAVATQFIKKYLTKLGINISETEVSAIEELVRKSVITINQKLVDDLKEAAPDGKLTEEQQAEVYNMTYNIIKRALSDDQFKLLEKIYGDVDTGIDVLIENMVVQVKEYKTLTSTSASITETTESNAGEIFENDSNGSSSGEIIS